MELTDYNFDNLTSNGLVLVDFWFEECPPCRLLNPILQNLSNRIIIGKLNIHENPITTKKFKISSVPTLIFFQNGTPVKRLVGLQSEAQLQKVIDSLI